MSFQNDKSDAAKPAEKPGDPNNPEALVRFMMTEWKPQAKPLPKPVAATDFHARRRAALSERFPGEVLIIPTGHEKVRANDTYYRFRPGSDFFYLTGNTEPDCVLVLTPRHGGGHDSHLFVEPNPGRASETFYTDRKKGELWVGARLGVEQSRARYGVDFAHPLEALKAFLEQHPIARVLRGFSHLTDGVVPRRDEGKPDDELATFLSEHRLVKDALEIKELKKVIDATKRGFEDIIRVLPKASSEREVEGTFNLRARVEGQDVGYGTIAASGANACILHWTRNDAGLKKKDLILIDAGVEGHALYTADITRTLPISGKFSKAQRTIYELVWRAQQAALAEVKPGNDFMAPNLAASKVLAQGLKDLDILPTSVEDALRPEHLFFKRWSLHNVSHMLGLDVHDCAKAREEVYRYGKLEPGMVLTVEPGLYFQLDDLRVPAKYRGIGVRIEDDVLVTESGMKNLSASIPSEAGAVEAWMKGVWKKKAR
ncbi:MAG: aminopeptidase P family protein [Myxococcaceae bacterium]|nr:aminopeptidase P family protein [Myxococcaceae bacterium]